MAEKSTAIYLYIAALAVVVILIVAVIISKNTPTPLSYLEFAQCLTDKGVKMYGAWWCSHCDDQKALFKDAFKNINYIECSEPRSREFNQVCKDAGVSGTPVWKFSDGSHLEGARTFQDLAQKSGCAVPEIPL